MLSELETEKDFHLLLKDNKILVLDFYATWCAPCKSLMTTLEAISKDEKYSNILFIKANIENENIANLVSGLQIRSVPTCMFFKDSELIKTRVGSTTKSDIESILSSILE